MTPEQLKKHCENHPAFAGQDLSSFDWTKMLQDLPALLAMLNRWFGGKAPLQAKP